MDWQEGIIELRGPYFEVCNVCIFFRSEHFTENSTPPSLLMLLKTLLNDTNSLKHTFETTIHRTHYKLNLRVYPTCALPVSELASVPVFRVIVICD